MVKKEIGKRMSKIWHEGGTDGDRRGSRQQSSRTQGFKVHHDVVQEALLQAGPYRMMVGRGGWWCHWYRCSVRSEELHMKPHTAASMYIAHGNYTHVRLVLQSAKQDGRGGAHTFDIYVGRRARAAWRRGLCEIPSSILSCRQTLESKPVSSTWRVRGHVSLFSMLKISQPGKPDTEPAGEWGGQQEWLTCCHVCSCEPTPPFALKGLQVATKTYRRFCFGR